MHGGLHSIKLPGLISEHLPSPACQSLPGCLGWVLQGWERCGGKAPSPGTWPAGLSPSCLPVPLPMLTLPVPLQEKSKRLEVELDEERTTVELLTKRVNRSRDQVGQTVPNLAGAMAEPPLAPAK